MLDKSRLPRHIAIIMDGNGRWAKERGLPRAMGHEAGIKAVREVVESCAELDIEFLTLYAFSVENWRRPKEEIDTLMRYLEEYLRKEIDELNEHNIRLMAIGRLEGLPVSVQNRLNEAIQATKDNTGLVLNLALNYSGRIEIIDAVKRLFAQIKNKGQKLDQIDEEAFSSHLYTAGIPDPDLLIRTSGQMRISNFLLWQISYSEIYVTPKLWPDFRKEDLVAAVADFQRRERRFGALG